jgi:hypothetical protein
MIDIPLLKFQPYIQKSPVHFIGKVGMTSQEIPANPK